MLVISNHLIGKMPIPEDAVVRINLAWVKNVREAKKLLNNLKHDVYLDYPDGRTKPPVPKISLKEAMKLTKHPRVVYFAVSNAEDLERLKYIKRKIDAELVPKIETVIGVSILPNIIDLNIRKVMLDKEDLYTNVGCNSRKYNDLVDLVRSFKDKIKILELQGVVFI